MYRWSLEKKTFPLQFVWKISRGQSTDKQLQFVQVCKDSLCAQGEIAGITTNTDKNQQLQTLWQNFSNTCPQNLESLHQEHWPTHWAFGIHSAWTHLQCLQQGLALHQWLNLKKPAAIPTSFSLPIQPLNEMAEFVSTWNLTRFPVLKLKVSQEHPAEAVQELARLYPGPLRIDANEAFSTACAVMDFARSVQNLNIQMLEEPLPRGSVEEYKKLKNQSPFPVFADESVQGETLRPELREMFHGINVKLMKAGSYERARQQIEQAKQWNMEVMLGCMVESTLAIAGALSISQDVDHFDLDGFLYFKDEPFALVRESQGYLKLEPQGSAPWF